MTRRLGTLGLGLVGLRLIWAAHCVSATQAVHAPVADQSVLQSQLSRTGRHLKERDDKPWALEQCVPFRHQSGPACLQLQPANL